MLSPNRDYQLHIISHTHWDREWYLSHESFRLLLVDLLDHLIDLMENDPGYRFFHMDGQTIVLEDYLEIRPHQRDRLARLIRDGHILIGPWYLQNDEFLASAEATVRNLLIGHRICREFDVEPMKVGYIPDQFGNISQMPQILRGFGIDRCIFGRGYRGPGVPEFFWRSPDGSEVFAIHMLQWYNNAQRLPRDPTRAISMIREIIESQTKANVQTRHLLLMNGVDHLQPQENLGEIIREVNARSEGFRVHHDTMPNYISAVLAQISEPRTFEGEFRQGDEGNVLSGTASSRVYLKMLNFACQQGLERWAEPLAVWARWAGSTYAAEAPLNHAWKLLIQCHPHDSICGCSIDEVHFQMEARFHRVLDLIRDLLARSMRHITAAIDVEGREPHSVVNVFNPLPIARNEAFEAILETLADEAIEAMVLRDQSDKEVPLQVLDSRLVMKRVLNPKRLPKVVAVRRSRVLIDVQGVPPCGYEALFLEQKPGTRPTDASAQKKSHRKRIAKLKGSAISAAAVELANEHLSVCFNANGSFDLRNKHTRHVYRGLHVFEDVGDNGNEYIFRKPGNDSERTTEYLDAELQILENSPLRQAVQVVLKWKLPPEVDETTESRPARPIDYRIASVISLRRGARYVEIATSINNTVRDHRLRALFPTALHTEESQADAPFDIVRRPCDIGEANRNNTHPLQTFFAVTDGNVGLAVFSAGMPEFEVLKHETTMALTLLRCVDLLGDSPPHQWIREQMEEDYTPDAQCLRQFTFRYAVCPFAGDAASGEIPLEADTFLNPPRVFQLPLDRVSWSGTRPGWPEFFDYFEDEASEIPEPPKTLPIRRSFLETGNSKLRLSAVKFPEAKQEGGADAVVRVVNLTHEKQAVSLGTFRDLRGVARQNLSESHLVPLTILDGKASADVTSRQVATFLLELD